MQLFLVKVNFTTIEIWNMQLYVLHYARLLHLQQKCTYNDLINLCTTTLQLLEMSNFMLQQQNNKSAMSDDISDWA